jgi:diaminohydroxyphosphoribosylaminopyrimidine deaminase/5-amino-6-(5-phosphoribosylamino)uracil reductase
VQQVAAVVAPKLLGGVAARTPLGDLGLMDVNQAASWSSSRLGQLGNDCLLELSL